MNPVLTFGFNDEALISFLDPILMSGLIHAVGVTGDGVTLLFDSTDAKIGAGGLCFRISFVLVFVMISAVSGGALFLLRNAGFT